VWLIAGIVLLVSSVRTIARTFQALDKLTAAKSNGKANGHANGHAKKTI
jgi:cholestenol delta-isomerase